MRSIDLQLIANGTMRKKKVMVAIPSGSGSIKPRVLFSIMHQEIPEGYELVFDNISIVERQPVQYARNLLLERSRIENCDYIWFFDDDQIAQFDTLKLLLESDKDIVTGVVPLRHQEAKDQLTNIFSFNDEGLKSHITDISTYKEPIIEVENCGTGCVLISRDVVDRMYLTHQGQCFEFQIQYWVNNLITGKPEQYLHQDQHEGWETQYQVENGNIKKVQRCISEDLCFFERCKDLGYKVYANLKAEVAHYGKQEVLQMKTHFSPNINVG